jgi:hypothetical protein
MDYMIGGCRVICNPHGYYNGYNTQGMNLNFDPNFEVETSQTGTGTLQNPL